MFTNDHHRLLWQSVNVIGTTVEHTPGPALRLVYAAEALPYLLGLMLIAQAFADAPRAFRDQLGWLLLGFGLPGVATAIIGLGLLPVSVPTPLGIVNVTMPFAFGAVAWVLVRHRQLLDLAPVAHRTVVAGMSEAVLVLDALGRVVELNPAAEQLTGFGAERAVGQPLRNIAPDLADVADSEDEICVHDASGATRFVDVQVSSLSEPEGRVIVLRDATRRRPGLWPKTSSPGNSCRPQSEATV